jgi:hypothetical protein
MTRGLPYRIATLVLFGLAAVLTALAWTSVRTTADAEAQVIAVQVGGAGPTGVDEALVAVHVRAQEMFAGSAVADAVRKELGTGTGNVVPDRVSLTTEQDGILLHVVGHDPDRAVAADLANTAAAALAGAGPDRFEVVAPADAAHATTSVVPGAIRSALPVALAAALSLGAALGLFAGWLPFRRALGTVQA